MDYAWVQFPQLLRSVLYVPGINARALEKAVSLPADAVILDLEDAVLPEKKAEARQLVRAALERGGFEYRKILVRVNHPDSEAFAEDVEALADAPANGIVLPKIEHVDTIIHACAFMEKHELGLPVWPMIETAAGLMQVASIAAEDHVEGIIAGSQDLARDLRLPPETARQQLGPHLAKIVAAARAGGGMVLDGVYRNIADINGFIEECHEACAMGFDGKTLIHPSMIEPCNAAFDPTQEALEDARGLIEASASAKKEGRAVAVYKGQMIEPLHAEYAQECVRKAEISAERRAEAHGEHPNERNSDG